MQKTLSIEYYGEFKDGGHQFTVGSPLQAVLYIIFTVMGGHNPGTDEWRVGTLPIAVPVIPEFWADRVVERFVASMGNGTDWASVLLDHIEGLTEEVSNETSGIDERSEVKTLEECFVFSFFAGYTSSTNTDNDSVTAFTRF